MSSDIVIRAAKSEDLPSLQEIRRAAFAPVFSSFRTLLGEELDALAQPRAEEEQAELLASMFVAESVWEIHAVELAGKLVGFVSLQLNADKRIGEIGLNAVHPDHAGKGLGTEMYRFALARMKDAGMRAATVSTGGDASHAPARRAYEKAGFAAGIPSVWLCRTL